MCTLSAHQLLERLNFQTKGELSTWMHSSSRGYCSDMHFLKSGRVLISNWRKLTKKCEHLLEKILKYFLSRWWYLKFICRRYYAWVIRNIIYVIHFHKLQDSSRRYQIFETYRYIEIYGWEVGYVLYWNIEDFIVHWYYIHVKRLEKTEKWKIALE